MGGRFRREAALVAAAWSAAAGAAAACPFCAGPDGVNPVRSAIFGADFWPHVLAVAAPFGCLLGIVALIHFGLPGPRGSEPAPGPAADEASSGSAGGGDG